MPYCKICNAYFPIRIKIDGKTRNLSSRKYCLKCSPFGLHNTSKLEKIKSGKLDNNGKIICVCKHCGREFIYDKNCGHGRTKCNSCSTKKRREERKIKVVECKGGKCVKCGYNKCYDALEFHHNNPEMKEISLSKSWLANVSWKRVAKELDKCILVCSNCHKEIHERIRSKEIM